VSAHGLRGAIVWAVIPYIPQAPFRLWLGERHPVATIPDAPTYARQARSGGLDAEQTFLVEGKLRPVVLLQDRPARRLPEIVALRMVRLEALDSARREAIRRHREPSLFHLPVRPAKYGLSKEMAVDLNALVRVHASAMLPRAVGALDESEMRALGMRLVEHLDIDLEPLIAERVEQRLDELTRPSE
jgi:mRNA-degrading endonuclease toxin of MazEF toxin-antitoxin module